MSYQRRGATTMLVPVLCRCDVPDGIRPIEETLVRRNFRVLKFYLPGSIYTFIVSQLFRVVLYCDMAPISCNYVQH